ncbi:MAG: nucleoside recognition protein, partial [Campylobacteraceae bacterium]|nr:nucleoside recognition protein [Campylobacteraceae bacterium]
SLKTIWIIVKLVIPIYILADILYFDNVLSYVSFLIEPFTTMIGLPPETSLAIISGMFLNVYAAIAFAAPLDLSIHQWTILTVFIGICHSLIVEGVIMKKIGISNMYSYSLRIIAGFLVAYITAIMPSSWFSTSVVSNTFNHIQYNTINELLYNSTINAMLLSFKIVILITLLIFMMDFIKTRKFLQSSQKNVSKGFSITVGVFLGITYGAGMLIEEAKSGRISKDDIFYIATFLLICHAIIEDTLLFVIFGADFTMAVIIRTVAAIVIAFVLLKVYQYKDKQSLQKATASLE